MINRQELLSDLQTLLKRLEADLLQRSESAEVPSVGETLHSEYERAKAAERTAQNYEDWRSDYLTQAAAAWVLSCVFVRFLEDNKLIDPPKLSGQPSAVSHQQDTKAESRSLNADSFSRLQQARDEHELYFREHPTETDREYLLAVFDELAKLPGGEVFSHQLSVISLPVPETDNRQLKTDNSRNWLSGDAAGELLRFFQKIEANTGDLIHDFTDPEWDTRFLGDLYQDLSEAARKKYALLQTPEFVEEFILDRTLDPALDEFGLVVSSQSSVVSGQSESRQSSVVSGQSEEKTDNRQLKTENFKIIDPACGSGHFLLGAFPRILDRWRKREPGGKIRDLVQKTLDSIHGVDMNPYAVAIARFRLLLMAMKTCGIHRLADAPAFHINLACGDSLRHGTPGGDQLGFGFADAYEHVYHGERGAELKRILRPGSYHAVVGNPPYITPKDRAANEAYRKWSACHRQYSLAVPFMQRIFTLAVPGGYTGQITANSFMKREFGKKLIETFLPKIDLTHVIDTSGAYIPGHGTPTVILFGRNRPPVNGTIRAVMGIRGEPQTPDDPAQGLVWQAILSQVDDPGSQSEFVSVSDSDRERFHSHPWSIGGGGAAELKEQLDGVCEATLARFASSIGFFQDTHADDAFVQPVGFSSRHLARHGFKRQIRGDNVRDWLAVSDEEILFPYSDDLTQWPEIPKSSNWSWLINLKTELWSRSTFGGGTYKEAGRPWYDYHQFPKDRARTPLSIVFAFVATHNHFFLDRGGKVFNRSAPVIKLPPDATVDDHLGFLGLLNSSVGCFWMKQIFYPKGGDHVGQEGARIRRTLWDERYEYTGTGLQGFPLPNDRPLALARHIDHLAQELQANSPAAVIAQWENQRNPEGVRDRSLREILENAWAVSVLIRGEMILMQEDLDWQCYRMYGLIDEDVIMGIQPQDERRSILPGMRAFEVLLAQELADGKTQTSWFERHGITPRTEIPDAHDIPKYREIVNRRIEIIRNNREIALIEQPEYKRRWYKDTWGNRKEEALREWLLDRLESYFDFDGRMQEVVSGQSSVVSGQPGKNAESRPLIAESSLTSVAKLADVARQDAEFLEVGEVYRDDRAFDVQRLVTELVGGEHVPLLPILRYKPSGLRRRKEWEKTWELQRREDAASCQLSVVSRQLEQATDEAEKQRLRAELDRLTTENRQLTTSIPVPPKYKSSDFLSTGGARYWALRGKLDVPKERWVSFPHCEGPDGTLPIAWTGYDHLQLARAISAYFVDIQERLGGRDDPRLVPLLAGIIELLPWLKQWHHDLDPDYNQRMDEVFEGFITEEAKNLGLTIEEIKSWEPPKKSRKRSVKRKPSKELRDGESGKEIAGQ